jgi:hypothetical protein
VKAKQRLVTRILLGVVLVSVAVFVNGFSSRSPILLGATEEATISLGADDVRHSSPAAADFDGDGDKEIVIAGEGGTLYVIAYESSWSVAWSRQTAADLNAAGAPTGSCSSKSVISSSPAVADLNGDGKLEIVVSTGGMWGPDRNGGVLVYQYDSKWSFSLLPDWPQPRGNDANGDGCWDGIWSTPALGDLDGDGDLEVVVEGFDRRIHAWHHDGTVVAGWPIYRYNDQGTEDGGDCLLRGGFSSPALGDIDGDGLLEVVVGTNSPPWDCPGQGGNEFSPDYSKGTVWAINGDSSNVPGWPVATENNVQSSPALGDIDGDGELEVVVGSAGSQEGGDGRRVYAWNGDGSVLTGWPKVTAGDVDAAPALGDLDGDGDLEVVVGCGTEGGADCAKLYAWHGDGSPVGIFPVTSMGNSPYTPILADYDGDDQIEILITNRWSPNIRVFDDDGISRDPALLAGAGVASAPLVDDVDNDGDLEVVIGAASSVHIWSTGGTTDDERPWPMFHRDVRRTGRYPQPPKLNFPDDIRVYHKYGSGNAETGLGWVENQGDGSFDWGIAHSIPELRILPPTDTVSIRTSMQFVITTTGYITGWHDLGTVTITGTVDGMPVLNNPGTGTVWLYVGDPGRVYLPIVQRSD